MAEPPRQVQAGRSREDLFYRVALGELVIIPPLREQVAAFERSLVARTLAATGHDQSEAARRLGVSRMTLIERMKRYGLR